MEPVINAIGELAHRAFHFAINGIWPGLLLTGLVWAGWRFVRSASAASRYLVWWGVLATSIVAPVLISGIISWSSVPVTPNTTPENLRAYFTLPSVAEPSDVVIDAPSPSYTIAERAVSPVTDYQSSAVPFRWVNLIPPAALAIWFIIACILMVRIGRAFLAVQGIKRRSRPFETSMLSDYLLRTLATGTRRGPVCVRLSLEILSPVAAGLGRPAILIPDRIASQLSDSELKAVVLHELSHLRRWDDLTKLLQKMIEALFFFHPAVFLIGRELELERELACDEWAVARTGARDDYARCLTRLVQLTHGCATTLIPGVLSGRKQILKRFQRLLLGERLASGRFPCARLTGVLSIVAGMFLLVVHFVPAIAAPFDAVTLGDLQYAWAGPASPHDDSTDDAWDLRSTELDKAKFAYTAALAAQTHKAGAQTAALAAEVASSSRSGTYYYDLGSSPHRVPISYRSGSGVYSLGTPSGNANSVRTYGNRTVSVATVGETIFTPDRTDIRSITEGGRFELTEEDDNKAVRYLLVEADDDGKLTYYYEIKERPRDFDDAGRVWLAEMLSQAIDLRTQHGRTSAGTTWYTYDDDGLIRERYGDADDVVWNKYYNVDEPTWSVYDSDQDDFPDSGTWLADTRGSRGRIELRMRGERGRSQYTMTFRSAQLQGWNDEWRAADDPDAHFALVADAGTISFHGDFKKGRGQGEYSFKVNDDFRDFLIKSGCRRSELTVGKLIALVMFEIDREFVQTLNDAGFRDLSLDDLVELRIHGADAEYLKALKDVGYGDIGRGRLVEFLVHDVEPDDIRAFQKAGYDKLSPADLIAFRIHDVTPEYVQECRDAGCGDLSVDRLVEFKIHDVDPRDIEAFRKAGYEHLSPSDLVSFQIYDVSPEFLRECAEAGCSHMSPDQLVAFAIHGVDPHDIREFVDLGYDDLQPSDYIDFAIHNVSPGFVEELAEVGYKDLSPERLLNFRIHGVTAGFIRRAQKRAGEELAPEELLQMKVTGW